jgi:hypothetical protein
VIPRQSRTSRDSRVSFDLRLHIDFREIELRHTLSLVAHSSRGLGLDARQLLRANQTLMSPDAFPLLVRQPNHPPLIKDRLRNLFEAQCHNRIEPRGPMRRIEAKRDPHDASKSTSQDDRPAWRGGRGGVDDRARGLPGIGGHPPWCKTRGGPQGQSASDRHLKRMARNDYSIDWTPKGLSPTRMAASLAARSSPSRCGPGRHMACGQTRDIPASRAASGQAAAAPPRSVKKSRRRIIRSPRRRGREPSPARRD